MTMTHVGLTVPLDRKTKLHRWYLETFENNTLCPWDWGCIDAPSMILCGSRIASALDGKSNFAVSSSHWR